MPRPKIGLPTTSAREASVYDIVLKSIFLEDNPSLLDEVTAGRKITEVLNIELPRVSAQRADLVLRADPPEIQHIEFNCEDASLCDRMFEYYSRLWRQYHLPVRQTVIHVGRGPVNFPNRLELVGVTFQFKVIDCRDLDADQLLASGRPGDVALAILAANGNPQVHRIMQAAARLTKGKRRKELIEKILILSQLRDVWKEVELERTRMGLSFEVQPGSLLEKAIGARLELERSGAREEGREEGHRRALISLMEAKFQRVPVWAKQRVAKSDMRTLDRWLRKILTAGSVEGVVGRRS